MTLSQSPVEQPYRPHTLDEYPQFTPQEMGQRVLALINSLKSANDLTLQRIREVTGFPMEQVLPPSRGFSFAIHLPDSGWYYGLHYDDKGERVAWFDFYHLDANAAIPHLISMTPICLDFYAYVAALESMGFEKTRDEYSDLGTIVATRYQRNDVVLTVMERREADQPEIRRGRACLSFISFG